MVGWLRVMLGQTHLIFLCLLVLFCLKLNTCESSNFSISKVWKSRTCQLSVSKVLVIQKPGIPIDRAG